MNDEKILEKFEKRDETAISDVMQKYGKLLQNLATGWLFNPSDGEECVNDTYVAAWNSIPPEKPQNLSAYLVRILRNKAVSAIRAAHAEKRGGENPLESSIEELSETLTDGRDFTADLEAEELSAFISRFLSTREKELPRKAFVRRYFYGDSISEIADAYQIGESKTKMMLKRTREKLRKELEKEGYLV